MWPSRFAGYLGLAAGIISYSAMFVLGALRPSYSHTVNAVSELGVMGAPNALTWNVIGFIIPGVMLSFAGAAIAASATSKGPKSVAFWMLLASGLVFAGQGLFPAEMANGQVDVASALTRAHFIASMLHGAIWLIATIMLLFSMGRHPGWRAWRLISAAIVVGVVTAPFALRGVVSDALVQRIAGAIYFLWYFVMSINLVRLGAAHASAASGARQASERPADS